MAQKKMIRNGVASASPKKSAKKSVPISVKKTQKPSIKKKPTGSVKKAQAKGVKKTASLNPSTSKKSKPVSVRKSTPKKSEKKKTVSPNSLKPSQASRTSGAVKSSVSPSSTQLTPTDRYNIGGLFACAIEREMDMDCNRLRSVLRELELSSLEKDNLIRLSQGLTFPKLFADGIALGKVGGIVERIIKFAVTQGAYRQTWQRDIRQVANWLGMVSSDVEALEQRVGAR